MHGSFAPMLGIKDVLQVWCVRNATLKNPLLKPVGDYLQAIEIRYFELRLCPTYVLSLLWALPRPMESRLTIMKCAPFHHLHRSLLSWAGTFSSFVTGALFLNRTLVLDVTTIGTLAAALEALRIPIGFCVRPAGHRGGHPAIVGYDPVLPIIRR